MSIGIREKAKNYQNRFLPARYFCALTAKDCNNIAKRNINFTILLKKARARDIIIGKGKPCIRN